MKAARCLETSASTGVDSLLDAVRGTFHDGALASLLGVQRDDSLCQVLRRVALRPAAEFVRRPSKRVRGRVVELGWELAGGHGEPPSELAHIVELIHAGSMIVDDIEDGSMERRGAPALHVLHGVPLALNTGNLLYFLPLALLERLQLDDPIELEVHRRIARTMVRAHFGQALDVGTNVTQLAPAETLRIVRASSELKTGSLMSLAASIGAVAAGSRPGRVRALARFGAQLGMALQMCDDLGNLRGQRNPGKRHEDLRLGRPTWVWAWLARDLRVAEFAALQRHAAAVQAGEAPCAPLAEQLSAALGGRGRVEARARLRRALADLRRAFGSPPAVLALAAECARLEASYG